MSQDRRHDDDLTIAPAAPTPGAPGRSTATSRLSARPVIFRVESAEAARELGAAFGPRNANGVAAGADTLVQRAASSSSGAPLPASVRGQFESSLGADLSGVRVHTGSDSAQAASAVGAKAYTTGQDIHFGAGQYKPADPFGLHLLAHEVAHTVQQSGGAATTQYKLEVSTPGDRAEVEADRAADAMVSRQPAAVTIAAGLSRKLHRQTPATVNVGDEPDSIQDLMGQASQQSVEDDEGKYTWGSANVESHDADGNVVDNDANPLVANSKKNGSMEKFRAISEELDLVKPPILSWKAAHAAADVIKLATDINPDTPTAYTKAFQDMHVNMSKGQTSGINKVLESIRTAQRARQKTALLQLQAAGKHLETAKSRFQLHQNKLQQLAAQNDLKDNAAAKQAIDAQIATYVTAITYTAKAIAMVSSGIGMLSTGGVSLGAETLGGVVLQEGVDVPGTMQLPSQVKGGADWAGGQGDGIKWVLEKTVFAGQLAKISEQEAKINARIQSLQMLGIKEEGVAVASELSEAQTSVEAAKQNKEDADREFHNAIIQAGKDYDQRKMTDAEKEKDTPAPKSHIKGEVTMEGLMAVYSTMIRRGQSRKALLTAAANCPHLTKNAAVGIITDVMDSGNAIKDPLGEGEAIGATTPLDHHDNAGASGVDHIVAGAIASQLKQGVAMALAHIEAAKKRDADETSVEATWDGLVSLGTGGMIAKQI